MPFYYFKVVVSSSSRTGPISGCLAAGVRVYALGQTLGAAAAAGAAPGAVVLLPVAAGVQLWAGAVRAAGTPGAAPGTA